jgi:signal transduction histidine kinase
MAAKPKHDPDERVAIPLDPETALRGLLQVRPDGPGYPLNGQEFADKHGVEGLPLRNMLRRHPSLAGEHEKWEHYRIDRDAEALIVAHPEFQALPRTHRVGQR